MKVVLVGSKGMLAWMVARHAPPAWDVVGLDLPEFDVTDRERVLRTMADVKPDLLLNCAAYTDVDGCESNEALATAVNGYGPGYLAEAAAEHGAILVHLSTDYVFDGAKRTPYTEEDPPGPRSAYGRSKWLGEKRVAESGLRSYYIVRTSWLYGPRGKNFVETIARLSAEREELRIIEDQVGTPTYTEDLAGALITLLDAARIRPRTGFIPRAQDAQERDTAPYGTYHFSNEGVCSWYAFACEIVDHLRRSGGPVRVERILPIPTEAYPLPAKRPAYSVLSKERYKHATGADIPDWKEALARYMKSRVQQGSE